jgi:hypothetical protein
LFKRSKSYVNFLFNFGDLKMSYLNAKYDDIEIFSLENGSIGIQGIAEKCAVVNSKTLAEANVKSMKSGCDLGLSLRLETLQKDGKTTFTVLEYKQKLKLHVGYLTEAIPPSVCSIFVNNIEFLQNNDLQGGLYGKTLAVYLADATQMAFITKLLTEIVSMDISFMTQDGRYFLVNLSNKLSIHTIH